MAISAMVVHVSCTSVGNFTLTDWENGVLDHLVAIDRSGVPLYSVINTNNVPELPDSTLLTMCIKLSQSTTRLTPLLAVQTPQAPSLIFKPMWTMARAKRRKWPTFLEECIKPALQKHL